MTTFTLSCSYCASPPQSPFIIIIIIIFLFLLPLQLRKPLIERKRRERINNCLDQLKETVIGAFRLDQSKLEKADILEMTVKHLQNIQSNKLNGKTRGSVWACHIEKVQVNNGTIFTAICQAGRQHQREGPTDRDRPELHSSQLGALEMWRPW
uniref:BHLH domain-containing protein n=1 Tax=Mola mola TaxID=94237 RepID=A0A3Q3WHL8_MOLML